MGEEANEEVEALHRRVRELEAELALTRGARYEEMTRVCEDLELALFVVEDVRAGTIGWMNAACARLLGYPSPEAARGAPAIRHYVDTKERAELLAHFSGPSFRANPVFCLDTMRKNLVTGEHIPVRMTGRAEIDATGMPTRFFCTLEDRRDAVGGERRFRDSESRFRLLFEQSPIGIALVHANGTLTRANRALSALCGVPEGDLPGRALASLVHSDDRAAAERLVAASGTSAQELRVLRPDGAEVWASLLVSWERPEGDDPVYGVVMAQDVTARRHLEDERGRRQRLEALAGLAAGIAHDFNNLLGAVVGGLDLVDRVDAGTHAEGRTWLDRARAAALRARDLTHRLMTFADGGAPVRRPVDIARAVRLAADAVFDDARGPAVHVRTDALPLVEADPVQLGEALRSLLVAARAATPEGEAVEVSVTRHELGAERTVPVPPGVYVRLAVADAGPTPTADALTHLFDPFATAPARGDGFSLAAAWSILRRHGGHLGVAADTRSGVTFVAWLPVDASRPAATPPTRPTAAPPWRVLVLDDDPDVRDVVVAILEKGSFRVDAFAEGGAAEAAVRTALAEGRPYAAAVLDLTIPGGRGGLDVIGPIGALDPDLRTIVSSGYADIPVMADPRAHGFAAALPKPYRASELLATVQRLLAPDG